MRRLLLLLISTIILCNLNGKTRNSIDSIRIVGWQYDIELQTPVSRRMFMDEFQNSKDLWNKYSKECLSFEDSIPLLPEAYVDTIISSRNEIKLFLKSIANLKRIRKNFYDTKHYLLKACYNREQKRIIWSLVDSSDYKLLFIIFRKDSYEFLWADRCYVEIGEYTFEISNDLKKILSKYTHIYDNFLTSESK